MLIYGSLTNPCKLLTYVQPACECSRPTEPKTIRIFGPATGAPLVAVPKREKLRRNSELFLRVTQQSPVTRTKNQFQKVDM